MIELVLFETRPDAVRRARAGGIDAGIVDLEWRGKRERQSGADTEINRDTPEDLATLAAAGLPRRWCRIEGPGRWTAADLESVLAAGATDVLLPMVTAPGEVCALLERLAGRARCGILVETPAAVAGAAELAELPLDCVYVGLNDLAIGRGSPHLFTALVDGTVERLRDVFSRVRFGVAGATRVDRGFPVPSALLLGELARLRCDFTFLRRSFKRDVEGCDLGVEVARIRELWRRLEARSAAAIAGDRERFLATVEPWLGARLAR